MDRNLDRDALPPFRQNTALLAQKQTREGNPFKLINCLDPALPVRVGRAVPWHARAQERAELCCTIAQS